MARMSKRVFETLRAEHPSYVTTEDRNRSEASLRRLIEDRKADDNHRISMIDAVRVGETLDTVKAMGLSPKYEAQARLSLRKAGAS